MDKSDAGNPDAGEQPFHVNMVRRLIMLLVYKESTWCAVTYMSDC
jgi:hypothetical protein